MQFLMRKKKNGRAHLWDGRDTICRMHSTGGLTPNRYEVTDGAEGLKICHMCNTMWKGRENATEHRLA